MSKQLAEVLLCFEEDVKKHLLNQPVLYFDESGLRCDNSLYWGHVAVNEAATLYQLNKKRGKEAMEDMGILVPYQGIAVHDEWVAYFDFKDIKHGLCNAHLLRELTHIEEKHKESWAKEMKELLIQAKQKVEDYLELGALPKEELELIETRYHQIIQEGLRYHSSLPSLARAKRGRAKQRPGKNLLDRMQKRMESVLLFMKDFQVEFTNNQSEREIRRLKVKQKVSGSFRTKEGGAIYLRLCSYISTAHKQGWDILESLIDAARGSPRLLTTPS
jgi:transposase